MSGDGFDNPIIGSAGSLVRERIKSPNYVPLLAGWLLDRDGNVDLNSVSARGSLRVDGNGISYLEANSYAGIPKLLLQPETAAGLVYGAPGSLQGNIAQSFPSTEYLGQVILRSPWWSTVFGQTEISLSSRSDGSTVAPKIDMMCDSATSPVIVRVHGELQARDNLTVADIECGRGWVNGVDLGASVVLAAASPETTVMTLPFFVYKAGRAYKMEFSGLVQAGTAGNIPTLRMRRTSPAGPRLTNGTPPCTTANPTTGDFRAVFKVGAADVNAALVLTMQPGAAGNVTLFASATTVCSLDVYDIGIAANHANAPSI